MLKVFRHILWSTLIIFTVSIILFIVLYNFTPAVDLGVQSMLNRMIKHGIKITYSDLSGNLLNQLRLRDLQVVSGKDTLRCPELILKYNVLNFLRGRYDFDNIALKAPTAVVRMDTAAGSSPKEPGGDSLAFSVDLSAFPFIRVGKLLIRDGQISLLRGKQRNHINRLSGEFALLISREKVRLIQRSLAGEWRNRKIKLDYATFRLTGTPKRLTLNQLQIKGPAANIYGHGEVELQPKFRYLVFADTSRVKVSLLHELIPGFRYKTGFVDFNGSFIGVPGNFNGNLFIRSRLDSLRISDMKVHLRRSGGTFFCDQLKFQSNFGNVAGKLIVSPGAEGENAINISFSRLNLKKINLLNQTTSLNGKFALNFDQWNFKKLSGEGNFSFFNLHYGNVKIDSILFNILAKKGDWQVVPGSRIVVTDSAEFLTKGRLLSTNQVDLQLTTRHNHLDSLFNHLGSERWNGLGNLEVHLSGAIEDPDLSIKLNLDSLSYQSVRGYGVTGKLDISGIRERRIGALVIRADSGFVDRAPITDAVIEAEINKNSFFLNRMEFQNEENHLLVKGNATQTDSALNFYFQHFKITRGDYELSNAVPISGALRGDTLIFYESKLTTSGGGGVNINGYWAIHGKSNLLVNLSSLNLRPFNAFFQWPYKVSGLIDADLRVRGSDKDPANALTVAISGLKLDEHSLGDLSGELKFVNKHLSLKNFRFGSDSSFVEINGDILIPKNRLSPAILWQPENEIRLRFAASGFQIGRYAFLFKVNYPLQGILDGRFNISGTVENPSGRFQFRGEAGQVRDYRFSAFDLRGEFTQNLFRLNPSVINFQHTRFNITGSKKITWNWKHPANSFENKGIDFHVAVREDSLNFLGVINPEIDRIIGKIDIAADIQGTTDHPIIQKGDISITNGKLYLTKIENPIRDFVLEAHIDHRRLLIDRLEGKSPKSAVRHGIIRRIFNFPFKMVRKIFVHKKPEGKIKGEGWVDLSEVWRPRLNLTLSLKEVYLNYFIENTELVLSSPKVTISGQDTIWIAGNILVNEGDVEMDFSESEKNLLLSKSTRANPPFIAYRLELDLPGHFFARSKSQFNRFDVQMNGRLRMVRKPRSHWETSGFLEIEKGKYFLQVEDFQIKSGKIEFVNPEELPRINIYAQKRKFGLIFDLSVQGKLDNPSKKIKIRDAKTNNELVYHDVKDQMALLTFGVTFKELGNQTESILLRKGEEVLAQNLINQIESEARHFVGLDQIRMEKGDNDESEFRDVRLSQATDVSYLALGKYLSSNVYLEYRTRMVGSDLPGFANIPAPNFSWQPGNEVYLQYRINRNWFISTLYKRTLLGNDKVKFDVSWNIAF